MTQRQDSMQKLFNKFNTMCKESIPTDKIQDMLFKNMTPEHTTSFKLSLGKQQKNQSHSDLPFALLP